MDDVVATSFISPLTLDEMHAALAANVPGVTWSMGESHYEGNHVRGHTPQDVDLRILAEAGRFCIETYFPLHDDSTSLMDDAKKVAFVLWCAARILPAVQASDCRPA
jgi:hypothetical protein